MVEILVLPVLQAEDFVHRVVEVTADARATYAGRFRFQVEHLPDKARLPEEPRVEPRAVTVKRRQVLGDHPETETTVARNVLSA